jgi:hypothetical protein
MTSITVSFPEISVLVKIMERLPNSDDEYYICVLDSALRKSFQNEKL